MLSPPAPGPADGRLTPAPPAALLPSAGVRGSTCCASPTPVVLAGPPSTTSLQLPACPTMLPPGWCCSAGPQGLALLLLLLLGRATASCRHPPTCTLLLDVTTDTDSSRRPICTTTTISRSITPAAPRQRPWALSSYFDRSPRHPPPRLLRRRPPLPLLFGSTRHPSRCRGPCLPATAAAGRACRWCRPSTVSSIITTTSSSSMAWRPRG